MSVEGAHAGSSPVLEVRNLVKEYQVRGQGGVSRGIVQAVSDVSFQIESGESFGIVGETGSGKSSLASSILQMPRPGSGEVLFQGTDLVRLRGRELTRARRQIQMIFQDPFGSLDPTWRVASIVAEPLAAARSGTTAQRQRRVAEVLELVGLDPARFAARRPRELSGGQCQRVAIARALTLSPALIICDEAVSSLDVLIQAQVLKLFERLRAELGLSYMFIAHDLAVVEQASSRLGVLYLGKMCEIGASETIFADPLHPYTWALMSSVPVPDPAAPRPRVGAAMSRETPSPMAPPSGCRFRTRCPRATALCGEREPPMRAMAPGHSVACHYPLDPAARAELRADAAVPWVDADVKPGRTLQT
jgi:oligopeptide transport system ATP-binding protein